MKILFTILVSILLISSVFAQPDPDIAGYNMHINKLDNNRFFQGQEFIWSDTLLVFGWVDGDSTTPSFISPYPSSAIIGSPLYFVNDSSLWAGTETDVGINLTFDRGVYEFTVTALDVAGNESGLSEPVYIRFIRKARVPMNLKFE
jgi:hypothetical protein